MEFENQLESWLIKLSECGSLQNGDNLKDAVQKIVKAKHMNSNFKDGRPDHRSG